MDIYLSIVGGMRITEPAADFSGLYGDAKQLAASEIPASHNHVVFVRLIAGEVAPFIESD